MRYHSDFHSSIERDPKRSLVWFSLVGGLLLNLLPYPDQWFIYKPDFVALFLAVWSLRLSKPVSFSMVIMFGVLMDVAYTATLGQHVFAYSILLAVATLFRRPYSIANRLHRSIFILLALVAGLSASLFVSWIYEDASINYEVLYPALIGAVIWFVFPVLTSVIRPWRGGGATEHL